MTTILIDSYKNAYESAFLFEDPHTHIIARTPQDVPRALRSIEEAVEAGDYAAGFFSYELGYLMESKLESRLPEKLKMPLIWFAVFSEAKKLSEGDVLDFLEARSDAKVSQDYCFDHINLDLDREAYRAAFDLAKQKIASGDIYQINLTFKAHFQFKGDCFDLYRDLKHKQKMRNGALIQTEEFTIVSASPELFISIDGDQAITGPMKGTASRGYTYSQDEQIKTSLQRDIKTRAENLMIVDLMRNDLGRISETGKVKVSDLFTIETYPTLHQMVSYVGSELVTVTKPSQWLRALFPPGSITGAPKVRAMELISELEREERGVYTGSVGMLLPEGEIPKQSWFNVAIRTLTIWPNGDGEMGIGSGVVSDSSADDEYDECVLKMKFLTDPKIEFQLIETYAYAPDEGYLYYRHHLDRLTKSASYFNFPCDLTAVETALRNKEKEFGNKHHRVRLLLSGTGAISTTATPVDPPNPEGVMRFVVSDERMDKDNVFLYHKTTNRSFYDNEHKEQTGKYDCDEVLFMNEEGQITEGSRTNFFIERDDLLLTPPVECGLLAGTLRAELLKAGKAREAVLTMDDLNSAEHMYLGNSVRGLLRAELVIPFSQEENST